MDLGKQNKQIFVKQISTSGWEQGGAHTDYENVFKIGNPGDGIFVSSEGDRFIISGVLSDVVDGTGHLFSGFVTSLGTGELFSGLHSFISTGELFSGLGGGTSGLNVYIGPVGENTKGSGVFIEKDENRLLFRSVVGGSGIQITGHTGDLVIDFTGKPTPTGINIGTDSSATGLSGVFRGGEKNEEGDSVFQFRSLSGAGNVIVTGDTGRLIISGNDRGGAGGGGGGGGGYTGHHIYSGGLHTGDSGVGGILTGTTSGFTGSFEHSFSEMMVTGDITGFNMSGFTTGAAATIKITCPTGNNVTFMNEFTFIGEKPVAFHSGKTGIMVFTSFDTGGPGPSGIGWSYAHNTVPSGVLVAYGVQD